MFAGHAFHYKQLQSPVVFGRILQHLLVCSRTFSKVPYEPLDIKIYPTKLRHRDLRTEIRNVLARALEAPTLSNLESLSLILEEDTPANHDYQTAWKEDPNYPNGDNLGRALCRLAQTSLRDLSIIGLVSPVLWGVDPTHPDREAKTFPYLEQLSVRFALHTYDGRWYYTGSQSMDDNEDAGDEENHEDGDGMEDDLQRPLHGQTDPDSDFGSSSSDGTEYTSQVNWEREKYLDGEYPCNIWRTEPDPKMFDPLIQGFVSATHRMPRLQVAEIVTDGPENGEFGNAITYAAPGAKLQSEDWVEEVANLSNPRWIVALGFSSPWMLPDPIPGLMEKQLGADGQLIIKRTYYL